MVPVPGPSAAEIADRVEEVRRACSRCGSQPVEIVAVSKGHSAATIAAAYGAGLRLFGENYADELVAKANELSLACPEIRWTFQGQLQTNKINRLAPFVALWQTVDSPGRVEALARRAPDAAVCIQVNLTGIERQGGLALGGVPGLVAAARNVGLNVRGLMGIGFAPGSFHFQIRAKRSSPALTGVPG